MKRIFFLLTILSLFSLMGNEVSAAALSITTKNLPDGTVGLEYSQQVQAQGGTALYTFSLKSGTLPPGLTLASNGTISGRATKNGALKEYKFSIRVVDSAAQIADKNLSIFITVTQLKVTNPAGDTVPSGILGEPYQTFTFSAEGGIPLYTWTNPQTTGRTDLSSIGLQLSSDGKLTGTPTKSGNFNFAVRTEGDPILEGAPNVAFLSFKIEIKSVPFEITTLNLSPGQLNAPYRTTLSAHGGTPPYSWSIVTGALPDGLKLSGAIISGTPTKEGDFSFTVLAKDSKEAELAKPFSILIEKSCQCSDGTPCGSCKAGSSPSYCDGNTKTLINNEVNCQTGSGNTGDGSSPPGGGISSSGGTPTGKLEVNWPNSPMGTALTDNGKLTDLIKYLYEWGISLGGFAAFIALIIAGFQYLTSAGNAGKMSDAMSRIRSAGLGLVLLFSSFLILNTINPQLTELKMPTISPGSKTLDPINEEGVDISGEKCEGATLYSETNYNNPFLTLNGPKDEEPTISQEVNSIKMDGGCQVILYRLSNYGENSDKPSVPIYGDRPNIGGDSGGITKFGSVKLSEISQ